MRQVHQRHGIVVIVASAGGVDPLRQIIAAVPVPCSAAIFIVLHIGNRRSVLPDLLMAVGKLPAAFAQDGEPIEPGRIYVAPPDYHVTLGDERIHLSQTPKVHFTRPSGDPLFISAAEVHGRRVMGIVLSGGDGDGAIGLRTITEHGGAAIVQDPQEAAEPSMPLAALCADHPACCLSVREISEQLRAFCARHWAD